MRMKTYDSFAEQKIDQRIGLIAFFIVNILVVIVMWLLITWNNNLIAANPAARYPTLQLTINLLPWVANIVVLLWAAIFRRYIAGGYLVGMVGTLLTGIIIAVITLVAYFVSAPLQALFDIFGDLAFVLLALLGSIFFLYRMWPVLRRWWRV